jgi:hypothetical protein
VYQLIYGDCLVPKRWESDPSLGIWVSTQRQRYRKGLLSEDRQIKLERMDFSWEVRDVMKTTDLSKEEVKWNRRYEMLLVFREEYGHCDVPQQGYEKDKSLGNWVTIQRIQEQYGTLREARKKRLDEIGFKWSFEDRNAD